MSSKHTPGPWAWEAWGNDKSVKHTLAAPPSSRRDGPSEHFPSLGARVLSIEDPIENPADVALIAAAPDLLEACEAALLWLGDGIPVSSYPGDVVRCRMRTAIKKARGEP